MPYGRSRRHGEQSNQVCPRRIYRFLEPCLLMLLCCNEAHGYELLNRLAPFGFDQNPVGLSTVYRILRDLEDRGFVQSHWDAGNAGPARRLYQLTEEGDRYLARWVQDLRETDRVLRHFLDAYGAHMKVHQ
ncbi:MAG: helix-turn-helix transcriptional regulator [Anaerolineae bacterium]|nr:helix-turn-helix transcriptional regulator [Anaerolineae bacterium]